MPTIISDSSTLIHLAKIEKLNLLRDFYKQIILPPAVWKEVVEEGKNRSGVAELKEAKNDGWIVVKSLKNKKIIRLLKHNLDTGEAEAIGLAIENSPALLLIDESDGRKIARLYDIEITGVIGILLRAKKEGKIESLQAELDNLIQKGSFWISDYLYTQVLQKIKDS